MEATEVGIIFIDREMNIKRYTLSVKDIFNMLGGDEGRPLSHVTHKLNYDGLGEDAQCVE